MTSSFDETERQKQALVQSRNWWKTSTCVQLEKSSIQLYVKLSGINVQGLSYDEKVEVRMVL